MSGRKFYKLGFCYGIGGIRVDFISELRLGKSFVLGVEVVSDTWTSKFELCYCVCCGGLNLNWRY